MSLNATKFNSISEGINSLLSHLLEDGKYVDNRYWQAQKIEKDDFKSYEVQSVGFTAPIPETKEKLVEQCEPNTEWADEQFDERVCGRPLNPMPSYQRWPFWKGGSSFSLEIDNEKFSHTYAERFWPKYVDDGHIKRKGIRFEYGDTNDVVALLERDPYTRQAFLPIWHPEDTGQVHRMRVPCTIGSHFMMRDNKLNTHYIIRSCDALRYLRDDIYMACRLNQWMLSQLRKRDSFWNEVAIGSFTFHCFSLHIFKGDLPILKYRQEGK
jgi:thymidylate synthase